MSHGSIVVVGFSLRKGAINNSKKRNLKVAATFTINPAIKHCNDVILSDAKNLAFSCCYEILHSVQDDNYNCRVNNKVISMQTSIIKSLLTSLCQKGGKVPLFGKEGQGEIFQQECLANPPL